MTAVLIIILVVIMAYIDHEHYIDQDYIEDHTSRWLFRLLMGVLITIYSVVDGVFYGLIFVALFDSILNYLNGKNLFYLGGVAKWDLFWKKHIKIYITLKVVCLLSAIIIQYGQV